MWEVRPLRWCVAFYSVQATFAAVWLGHNNGRQSDVWQIAAVQEGLGWDVSRIHQRRSSHVRSPGVIDRIKDSQVITGDCRENSN